jgi:hypothetical protein
MPTLSSTVARHTRIRNSPNPVTGRVEPGGAVGSAPVVGLVGEGVEVSVGVAVEGGEGDVDGLGVPVGVGVLLGPPVGIGDEDGLGLGGDDGLGLGDGGPNKVQPFAQIGKPSGQFFPSVSPGTGGQMSPS